ncbi:Tripartite-type tricarboxylate transporter, receptor component TctC [Polaromonas sp. OV174]|uniref:Bug family tripartite tricarboxylate transporter substrate binding protein n=1 Tax=Polaromonas sp. OV174 TaxID=1855300 RepID=UPI0008EA898B|nr:tripartite tricarboxylate transporter substrate binding protein [Polaromonas sp. OV174]SFB89836.1 Tripartite-type tricarboxylate transporter, receptor component TctC [Polaromonas sp. OV174]
MKSMIFGGIGRWLAVACAALAVSTAQAQSYPTKNITVVLPFGAGAAPDIALRQLAPYMEKKLGHAIVFDYRMGGGTLLASKYVAGAAPDGYTLFLNGFSSVLAPEVNPAVKSNHTKDMVHVMPIAVIPNFIVVNADLPVRTVPELVAYLKANPGKLSYATPGIGTGAHLQLELFKQITGTQMLHVPYKGVETLFIDLVSGRAQVAILTYSATRAYVEAGKLRIIGTTMPERLKSLPEIPTVAESGVRVEVAPWVGLSAPKGTPAQVVATLQQAVQEALAQPHIPARLASLGLEPMTIDRAKFQQYVERDVENWSKFIKQSGIKVE